MPAIDGGRLTAVSCPATPSQNLAFGYDALGSSEVVLHPAED